MRSAVLLSVLSGLLLTAGFPRLSVPFFSWFALVPLLYALRGRSVREGFLLGFICGLAHFVTALYWIRFVVGHYGGLPLPLAASALLLLCAYLALYPAAFGYLAQTWEKQPRLWVWGLPLAWVSLEWVRAHFLTGFPWANLGYTQTSFSTLAQIADLTGVYGVSWLIVFANTCLMSHINRYRFHGASLVLVACFLGALVYGSWRLDKVGSLQDAAPDTAVAVVQGNIEQSLKWDPAFQWETLERYRRLTLEAAQHNPRPELIVWPETSAPFFFGVDKELSLQVLDIVRETDVPLLFGSPGVERVDGQLRLKNMAYLLDRQGRVRGQYAKQHLVPFGEYVPLEKVLFFLGPLVQAAGDFVAGDDPTPVEMEGRRLGILICYEGIFPELARSTVNRGATVLINITNDAWFGNSSAPYQHMETAGWRAIENRVPLVRAANTGVSTVFDAAGRPCGTIPLNAEGTLLCTVKAVDIKTFYTQWGDVFAWSCFFATLGILAFPYVAARFRERLRQTPTGS